MVADSAEQVKTQAARRRVEAVNAEGSFGRWGHAILRDPKQTGAVLEAAVGEAEAGVRQ